MQWHRLNSAPASNTVDIAALPAGVYTISIQTKEGSAVEKFVKE